MQSGKRKLAAIVALDVADYSRLVGQDEEGTLRTLRADRADLIDRSIHAYNGRIANTAGDSLLLEFPSVVDAVRRGVAIQMGMAERNRQIESTGQIRFRAGIHVGDVVAEGDDLLGDGVNIAARLEALADPDGMILSDDAYRQVRDRLDLDWQDGGKREVKNIVRPVQVWRWLAEQSTGLTTRGLGQPDSIARDSLSIAVLAFKNLSGDPEQGYLADAIADNIATELSRFRELLVISRETAFSYREQVKTAKAIAAELGVDYLLEGSVQRAGERVRVNIQLIEAENERQLWTERCDRVLTDLFAVQDGILAVVVSTVGETVWRNAAASLKRKPIANFAAYDYVLRARALLHRFEKQSIRETQGILIKAIDLDPDLVDGHIALAWTYVLDDMNQ